MENRMKQLAVLLMGACLALPWGLGAHEHHAPHKGSLQVLGEEFSHYELCLDSATGALTVYVLDGEAEHSVRVKQKQLVFKLKARGAAGAPVKVVAKAVANELTGETVGDTSQFDALVPALKGATAFDGVLLLGQVKGQSFKNLKIKHPEGNEN
jgi:hypothetical protein